MTRVLPEPAPARTKTGPFVVVTARCCCELRPERPELCRLERERSCLASIVELGRVARRSARVKRLPSHIAHVERTRRQTTTKRRGRGALTWERTRSSHLGEKIFAFTLDELCVRRFALEEWHPPWTCTSRSTGPASLYWF